MNRDNAWRRLRRNPTAMGGLVVLAVVIAMAALGP
jgi:hypothetical protein